MSIQDFGTIGADASLKQVIDVLADLQDTLNFLLNGNLDVKNLRANSVNADRIKANTITADRMNVQQLSAISADLGKVVAGILIGAYISTADGTYPRIDFSSTGNLLAAYTDPDTYLALLPSYNATPALVLVDAGTTKAFLSRGNAVGGTTLGTFDTEPLNLQASGPLNLQPSGNLQINNVNGWSGPIDVVTSVTFGATGGGSYTTKRITVNKGIITNYA